MSRFRFDRLKPEERTFFWHGVQPIHRQRKITFVRRVDELIFLTERSHNFCRTGQHGHNAGGAKHGNGEYLMTIDEGVSATSVIMEKEVNNVKIQE